MKRNWKTRITSLVLVLIMLFSCFPGAAWAVDSGTDIKSVQKPQGISIVEDYDIYLGDTWLSELALPDTVMVTLPNDTVTEMFVAWDTSVLDPRTPGYYSIPGQITLPEGVTNSRNIKASITVQVREYTNLILNPSFEENLNGWYIRGVSPHAAQTDMLAADGRYSATLGGNVSFTNASAADTRNSIITSIPAGGQYFFGAKVQSGAATIPENITMQTALKYKTADAGGTLSATTTLAGKRVTVNTVKFEHSCNIVELPENVGWLRIDLNMSASTETKFSSLAICFDDVELIPLKYALENEPSGIKEIKTELLSHSVALNYPDYVGSDWRTQLGLPTEVEVLTENGTTAAVSVTWDYSVLDFTKYGKYTLNGTLDPTFPNPNGLSVQQNIYVSKMGNIIPNGNFENGNVGFHPAWTSKVIKDPGNEGNYIWYATKKKMDISIAGSYILFQRTEQDIGNLLAAFEEAGPGQYYFAMDAMSAPYDSQTPALENVKVWIDLRYNTNGTSTGTSSAGASSAALLSTTQWTTVSKVLTMESHWNWLRTDVKCNAGAAEPGGVYLDNLTLRPLNLVIPKEKEPTEITEILEEIPVRAVVQNYDRYVSGSWQAALGLAESVQVRTSSGNEIAVGVTWNYDTLNLAQTGKYILVGTLDSSTYPNPNNLTVQQVIHVRDYKNLLSNPSFENGITDWSSGSGTYTADKNNFVHGATSAKVVTTANAGASMNIQVAYVSSREEAAQKELASRIRLQGGGQYYFGAWAKFDGVDAENFSFSTSMHYKPSQDASSVRMDSETVVLSGTEFVQSSGIMNIPAEAVWARLDLKLMGASGTLATKGIYLDHAELIPLNVIVEQYEGGMQQVETLIPDRQIIQNYPEYIGEAYTTADLMLPETVSVRTTTGQLVDVDVKWDYTALDLTKTGTYTLYGVLEEIKIDNPNALVVKQKIHVVSKKNLFTNASFENEDSGWKYHSNITLTPNIMSPVHGGDYSMQFDVEGLESWTLKYIQSFYNSSPVSVGTRAIQTGAGRYFFGGWYHGTASSTDITVSLSMKYKALASGDVTTSKNTPQTNLSASKYIQIGDMVEIPDDVYWIRLDTFIYGTPEQMRLSRMYMDDFELIPLNVEVPNMTDIIKVENVADIYVHEGTSIDGLKLPEALQVSVKNGQKFDMPVNWDLSEFDPNLIGVQTITGSLEMGAYKNPKNFVPTAKIVIRASGEDLRQTIYISTSGDEANDGLSPNSPKKEVTKIQTYLKQGYNVMLKRGDTWYIPTGSITIGSVYGTEDAPLVVGAYGSGEKPTIAWMKPIEDSAWKLIDENRNVYAVDVSSLGEKNGETVHRCFQNDVALTHKSRKTYVALREGEFCSYERTLYVRLPEGQKPTNIEVTAYAAGHRLLIDNVTHLTLENLHIKGSSAVNSNIYVTAPTEYLKFLHVDYTHSYYYAYYFAAEGSDVHYKTEIGYCLVDPNFNEAEGLVNEGHWSVDLVEGILFNNGADGAWIHHNVLRDQGHGFITLQANGRDSSYETPGTYNCIIEDNLLEGVMGHYNRAFNMAGGYNLAGLQTCRDNIVRRNRCYGMNTASHLFGEDLLIYSNLMSYTHCYYDEDDKLFSGKTAQPWGWDTVIYGDKKSIGVMMVNNTFYNVSGAISVNDVGSETVYNNIYANNMVVNFTNDSGATAGGFSDITLGMQYFMNNCVYSHKGLLGHFNVDGAMYTAGDVNNAVAGYSGNVSCNPLFVSADLNNMDYNARMEFELSSESPVRYAGLSLYDSVYQSFKAWEWLKAEYTDINGVVYLAESPSIGAYSYCERIGGEVASVGTLPDILARPGATFDQLNLPDAVPAVNDQGIEVMLLTTWDAAQFDSSKPGVVTLTATLRNGPHTELNVEGKVATVKVNIKDRLELLNINTQLKNQTVLYGTSLQDIMNILPKTLDVHEESGYQEELPVTWVCQDYDPTTPGTYIFECVLPEDMISNTRDFLIEVEVRVLHEIGRGIELLINSDLNEGTSAAPWKFGFGTGSIRITEDEQYLYPGESAAAIVTAAGRYGSMQQDVTGQVKLMGDGKYLFKVYMRAFDGLRPIDSSYACLSLLGSTSVVHRCRARTDIGLDWVEYSMVMDLENVADTTSILFHTSTGKSEEDVKKEPISFIIAGCSLVYLGNTEEEVEATLDSMDLTWNAIKGENTLDTGKVMSDLELPTSIGAGSQISWSSSDESVISNDGKVTMGRLEKEVVMTATIRYKGIETVKKFTVTVPRDPDLPVFTGSLAGEQTVNVGDTFQVTVSTSAVNATTYNAGRFTMSFNSRSLEFVSVSEGYECTVEGGRLVFSRIGSDFAVSDTITVTFRALKAGMTDVKLVSLEMDNASDVTLDTLPVMNVVNGTATINVLAVEATEETPAAEGNGNDLILWIVIGAAAAVVAAGAVVFAVIIGKKKRSSGKEDSENE